MMKLEALPVVRRPAPSSDCVLIAQLNKFATTALPRFLEHEEAKTIMQDVVRLYDGIESYSQKLNTHIQDIYAVIQVTTEPEKLIMLAFRLQEAKANPTQVMAIAVDRFFQKLKDVKQLFRNTDLIINEDSFPYSPEVEIFNLAVNKFRSPKSFRIPDCFQNH